ncbi:hypothetical protein [Agrobacterium sp. lyk4-40-TYG-31]|uniref:hypothetical protein n=1 Tax=Agrobacterium sp. lyk4-40-TYG-31 TaxID=3040276 RepID=UPI00254A7B8D|nr:hypothetical protein [Agrobacterium sp. lyk4-40-TYG-31]
MPISLKAIKATSAMRSKYGRKKKGMYDTEVRYATGETAGIGSTTSKIFSKAKVAGGVTFNADGTYVFVEDHEAITTEPSRS